MPKSRDRGVYDRKKQRQNQRLVQDAENALAAQLQHTAPRTAPEPLEALNEAQGQLIATIQTRDIVFATGPAGTGKTYITTSLACEALQRGEIHKFVATRPMVACGEDMGFLPGVEAEKYAPWVEPIMDVLEERLGKSHVEGLMKTGRIEFKPLMFMRGKDWKSTWVLLDESQNTTTQQMKMFLTRIGKGSKLIIDGDISQTDLTDRYGQAIRSGLLDASERLGRIPEVGHIHFTREDIVRHGLVRKILECYED